MKVRCLVGGCGWSQEGEFSVALELAAEEHRIESHDWVKQGRVHQLDLGLVEQVKKAHPKPSGRKAELRNQISYR